MRYYSKVLSTTYGQGPYGTSIYSCSSSDAHCSTASNNNANNGLTNTGIAILGFVTLACLIVFIALVVRFIRRQPKPVVEQVKAVDDVPKSDNNHIIQPQN